MKRKADSLKRSIKLISPQPQTYQEKKKTQINNVRNEKGEVKMDITEIQRIIRDYYMQLFANEMENLVEMGNSQKSTIFQD